MSKANKIEGTTEAWEEGILGCDADFAKASSLDMEAVSEIIGLKSISIRMQPDLLEELKMLADINSIGYQPLIKQVLRRFVDAEKKIMLRKAHSTLEKTQAETPAEKEPPLQKCG